MLETAIATFGGAVAAFMLEAYRRHRHDINVNAIKGNRVLFKLQQNWNAMAQYRRDVIGPFRGHPVRGIAIPPSQEYELPEKINQDDLDFFMDKYPQLVTDVILEDERYRTNMRAINERSAQYRSEIQVPLGKAGFKETDELTKDDFVGAVGERSFVEIIRLTDQIIINIDSAIDSTMNIQPKLRAKLLYTCPRKGFINFEADKAAMNRTQKNVFTK